MNIENSNRIISLVREFKETELKLFSGFNADVLVDYVFSNKLFIHAVSGFHQLSLLIHQYIFLIR
jgi:hypothetical protein